MFSKKVEVFIAHEKLLDKQGKYLVALSGGADSVALLLTLLRLEYNVEAIHCNFHLRGEESDRDENFCRSLCEKHNVPFHIVHFDTAFYAEQHKVSIEMAARELRYSYFERLRNDIGADAICVAHHKDDSVETILINLIRGTGVHGLTGIAPRNGYILRPFLCVTHDEIVEYLNGLEQDYVTDSTNLVDEVVRNKIRLNILPLLRDINPAVGENIIRTAGRLREAEKVLDESVSKCGLSFENQGFIDVKDIQRQPSPEYFLFRLLGKYGFTPAQIEQIADNLNAQTGKEWVSPTGCSIVTDRGRLVVGKEKAEEMRPMRLPECGVYVCGKSMKLRISVADIDDNFRISKSKDTICLDAEKVKMPLTIRQTVNGDRFIPFGMKGSKLVSDFLTDRKKTLFEKRCQQILTDASDNILWVVGERPDNRYRITTTTRKALVISKEETPRHA